VLAVSTAPPTAAALVAFAPLVGFEIPVTMSVACTPVRVVLPP